MGLFDRLFKRKRSAPQPGVHATVTLWEPILPEDRGQRYEDPLNELLQGEGLGCVSGGGSQLTDGGEIEYVNIELELRDVDAAVTTIKRFFEEAEAPKLSTLCVDGHDVVHQFGTKEALAVFLAPEQLENNDSWQSAVADQLPEVLTVDCEVRHIHRWDDGRVGIFFYTSNARRLWRDIEDLVRKQPASRGARVVVRYGHNDLNPITVDL